MQRIAFSMILIVMFSLLGAERLSAGIVLSFAPAGPFTAGDSGTIDLLIHADAGTQMLNAFTVNVSLTPTGGSPVNGLTFDPVQTESFLDDPNYVFEDRSLAENTPFPVTNVNSPTALVANDQTDDGVGGFLPFTLVTSGVDPNQLLLRMNILAVLAGTYDIAVELTGAGPPTDFIDDNLNSIPFSRTPMSITVNAAAAVPEPATGFVCGLVAVSAVLWKRRRRTIPEAAEV
jgi:hypothetical protein